MICSTPETPPDAIGKNLHWDSAGIGPHTPDAIARYSRRFQSPARCGRRSWVKSRVNGWFFFFQEQVNEGPIGWRYPGTPKMFFSVFDFWGGLQRTNRIEMEWNGMTWMMAKGTPHFRKPPFLGTFHGKTGEYMVSCRFSLANPLKCGKSNGIDRPFLEDGFCHPYKWWFLGWFMALTILVGGFNPLKKYESQLRLFFPIKGKIKNIPNHQ